MSTLAALQQRLASLDSEKRRGGGSAAEVIARGRRPEPFDNLEELRMLELKWLAARLVDTSTPMSEEDRCAAATAVLDLMESSSVRHPIRDNSKPSSERKKVTDLEHYATFEWDKLGDETKGGDRVRWNGDQRREAAVLAIARAESAYPLQEKQKLTVERLLKLVDRPRERDGVMRNKKVWEYFENKNSLGGFFSSLMRSDRVNEVLKNLRAKPRK